MTLKSFVHCEIKIDLGGYTFSKIPASEKMH